MWIHESMFNSLFNTYGKSILPIALSNDNVTELMITMLFDDLKEYYGANVKLQFLIDIDPSD
jgi:hypothetical protein